ncbi:hypothetical protein INR49_007281 [Caranx melampygus]|nr:hypothetical protein INR49_007281 [Caranx melampygus]
MSGHRNDSSQMNKIFHPDDDEDHSSRKSSSPGSSSSGPPCAGGVGSGAEGGRETEERQQGEAKERKEEREEGSSSSCCPQSDLRTRGPTRLTFSDIHTVLIDVTAFNHRGEIVPQRGRDSWQSDFVKLPSSQRNHMTKSGVFKGPAQVSRWEVIHKQLKNLASKKEVSVSAVEEAIMKYNPRYKGKWTFDALTSFVKRAPKEENYYSTLFPRIAALALRLPEEVRKPVPLLKRGETKAITLSQLQISCLLANAFFCTFPHRNTTARNSEYGACPSINFNSLFWEWSESKREKLRAIMHYFNVVTCEKTKPTGLVTFHRRHLIETDLPNWRSCEQKLTKLRVMSRGSIETEGTGMLQVDFACSRIGGGVLGSGLVQEEILFLLNPELIVSRLFTEELGNTECLIITGSQQFSIYSGYGDTFEWAGPFEDQLIRDEWQRRKRQILAIDALNFKHVRDQYDMDKVKRELNKAYCGFQGKEGDPDIATGKWGCGAFKGDPQLKALIQLMAAAKAKRGVVFFTFGDEVLMEQLEQIYHLLVTEGITVDKLFRLIDDYCGARRLDAVSHVELFDFIRNSLRPSKSNL